MKFKRERKLKQLQQLSLIRDDVELAVALNLPVEQLVKTIRNAQHMYVSIPFTKKDGTPRPIRAPREDLKAVQRSILDVILVQVPLPECAYGFSAGRGIIENAQMHANDPYLLNIDIKDFFPSVHRARIESLFRTLGATPFSVTALTKLTSLEHALPQGAPSSPYIATLALDELDRRLTILCADNRLTYTRYFDDIAISGNSRALQVKDKVIEIIAACGYEAHTTGDKLQLYGPGESRLITGIAISDGKLSVPNTDELVKYIEALKTHGIKVLHSDNPIKERLSLRGKIVFLTRVDPARGRVLEAEFNQIVW